MERTPRDTKGEKHKDGQDKKAKPTETGEGTVISWKDVVLSDHAEWKQKSGPPGNMGIDWEGHTSKNTGICLMPLNLINVVDMAECKEMGTKASKWRQYMPNNAASRQFANRIRRYLQAMSRSKVTRHKKHGKLDRSSIIKLALPPIEGGEYNKKLFYEMDRAQFKDTAIFVLTDWSGSMNGAKMRSAADASQRLVWVMERVLKIPVALATFSNGRTKCDIGYIKPWATRGLSQEEIAKRFAKFSFYTSANNDADSLNWAWHQLKRRKESRKILIILSDGAPAGQWGFSKGRDNLKWLAKQIDEDKSVELYGVGIHSTAVKNYYKNFKVLNGPEQINETLFNLIKEGDTHVRRSL